MENKEGILACNMTTEAKRIAIAEACGWREYHEKGGTLKGITDWEGYDPSGKFCLFEDLPDYLNDLNAMHEAEEQAGLEVTKAMRFHLWEICGQMTAHHATAAQRAEAFLRAIGKWKK